jgi:hypothetical protein
MSRSLDAHLVLNEVSDRIISAFAQDRRGLQQYVVTDDYHVTGVRDVSGIVLETPSWVFAVRVVLLDDSYQGQLSAKELVEKNDLPLVVSLDDDPPF